MLLLLNVPLVLGDSVVDGSCKSAKESTGLVGLDRFDAEVEGGNGRPVPSMLKSGHQTGMRQSVKLY